jgi:hypothetical protein
MTLKQQEYLNTPFTSSLESLGSQSGGLAAFPQCPRGAAGGKTHNKPLLCDGELVAPVGIGVRAFTSSLLAEVT